jgi:cytochrome c
MGARGAAAFEIGGCARNQGIKPVNGESRPLEMLLVIRFVIFCVLIGSLAQCTAQGQSDRSQGNMVQGREIFQQCTGCHETRRGEKQVGPSLKGLFQRSRLRNGNPATEKNIRLKIAKGGDGMPSFEQALSPVEMDQLIGYMKGL